MSPQPRVFSLAPKGFAAQSSRAVPSLAHRLLRVRALPLTAAPLSEGADNRGGRPVHERAGLRLRAPARTGTAADSGSDAQRKCW